MRLCANCKFMREMSKPETEMGLYYCDVDKIKGKDYGHPITLDDKACKHWQAIIEKCGVGIIIKKHLNRFYAVDSECNIWASSRLEDIALTKALQRIRESFLLEKRQLDLFAKEKSVGKQGINKLSSGSTELSPTRLGV